MEENRNGLRDQRRYHSTSKPDRNLSEYYKGFALGWLSAIVGLIIAADICKHSDIEYDVTGVMYALAQKIVRTYGFDGAGVKE